MYQQQLLFLGVINVPRLRSFVIEFHNRKAYGFPNQFFLGRLRLNSKRRSAHCQSKKGKPCGQTSNSQFLTSLKDLSRSLIASSTSGLVVFSIGARRRVLP